MCFPIESNSTFKLLKTYSLISGKVELSSKMERDLITEIKEVGEAFLRKMEDMDRKIAKVKRQTKIVQEEKETILVKVVEVEAKIASTKDVLAKVNNMLDHALENKAPIFQNIMSRKLGKCFKATLPSLRT